MKYRYQTKTIEISGYAIESELNDMAEVGWRFVGFVPKSSYETKDYYDGTFKFADAIFERED